MESQSEDFQQRLAEHKKQVQDYLERHYYKEENIPSYSPAKSKVDIKIKKRRSY